MDLNELTPKTDEITITLKHPSTGEDLYCDDESLMTVTVWAPHTKAYKGGIYAQADKRIKAKSDEMTAEMLEEASNELLVTITKSWNIQVDGKKPKLTEAKARDVYDKVFWIKDQIQEGINSFEVFTQA